MKYSLSDFDDKLLNGFLFCEMAYALWEDIRQTADGIERLRLRKSDEDKKLVEELIPVAKYIQDHYSYGRQLKVKWKNGSQNYDAELYSSGFFVEHEEAPQHCYIEVTTAVHKNDHILRNLIHEGEGRFTVKGVKKDSLKKKYISEVYLYDGYEHVIDLADQILKRIIAKNEKNYPDNTVLIIRCCTDTLICDYEWEAAIHKVKKEKVQCRFKEVFVFDSNHRYTSTIYCHQENNTSL